MVFAPPARHLLRAKDLADARFFEPLDVDDKARYEELQGRGVEFVDTPEARPYGIDASFRDPSGNHIRLTQTVEIPA